MFHRTEEKKPWTKQTNVELSSSAHLRFAISCQDHSRLRFCWTDEVISQVQDFSLFQQHRWPSYLTLDWLLVNNAGTQMSSVKHYWSEGTSMPPRPDDLITEHGVLGESQVRRTINPTTLYLPGGQKLGSGKLKRVVREQSATRATIPVVIPSQ